MKERALKIAATAILITVICLPAPSAEALRLYDVARSNTLSARAAVEALRSNRIVLVGEFHNNADHHRAQLKVIEALHAAGHKVAVGLEMFRSDSQAALDQWVSGQIDEGRFESIYLDNWNYDWTLYRPIFTAAKSLNIPLVGLNVSRKITSQVAYHGFESLSEAQRGDLEGITCDVTPAYRDFIQRAYGAHGHGNMQFERFCEAQLVWDTAMAKRAVDYVRKHTDTILVILAGSGHARKLGIPTQIEKLGSEPYAVVLPETPGIFDTFLMTETEADYLLLEE
jgi:uncharacterized iron-regulated protein